MEHNKKKNQKFKGVLKNLKSNLCAFRSKDCNYDYAQYENKCNDDANKAHEILKEILNNNNYENNKNNQHDCLDNILSPRSKTQSKSRLPIYLKSDGNNTYQSNCDYDVPWHSTKIDLSQTILAFLQSEASDCFHKNKQNNSLESDSNSDDQSSNSDKSTNDEIIYACCIDYSAQNAGDLTVRLADRLSILHDDGSQFVLVKRIKTQKCGYVPRICILNVNRFLADLN